jgi:hypothetical protein
MPKMITGTFFFGLNLICNNLSPKSLDTKKIKNRYNKSVRIIETTGTFFGEIQWEKNMHKSDLI